MSENIHLDLICIYETYTDTHKVLGARFSVVSAKATDEISFDETSTFE